MHKKTNTVDSPSTVPNPSALNAPTVIQDYTGSPQKRIDLDLLLDKIDLVELAEQAGSQMRSSNHEHRGPCPLHGGKNKSAFQVGVGENGRQYWRCYTDCNTGGDSIDFVRAWKGMDFLEAVTYLAERAHIEIPRSEADLQDARQARQKRDLFKDAAQYFASNLWSVRGEAARRYLSARGFTDESLRLANLGYSDGSDGLQRFLVSQGADPAQVRESGLVRADGRDFTANADGQQASPHGYIIFCHCLHGRVDYFSARACTPADAMPDPNDKSRNLPGPRQPYWALLPSDPDLVIVEGQADAESLRQLGHSALALCGVAERLPESDLARIRKRRRVYLALDNDILREDLDEAERQQRREKAQVLREKLCAAFGPLTLVLPDLPHKDVNAWLQAGVTAADLRELLDQARTWIDILLSQAKKASPHRLDHLTRLLAAMLPQLPETLRARYSRKIQTTLGVGSRDLARLVEESVNTQETIYSEIKEGRLYFLGEPLGNFWAKISNELIVDDGLNPPTVRYGLTGGLANGQALQPVEIEARAFTKMDWVPDYWGMRPMMTVPPSQSYRVARAIQEVSLETVRRERLYTFSGWTENDGRRGFLSTSGLVSADGLDASIRVDLGVNNMRHYALVEPQNPAEAARASLDFLHLGPRQVTAPIWAAMFAAPLTSLRSLNAVMTVYGSTQSGKSTIAHLALTHFGPNFIQGRDYHAPIDWTSSVTALEEAMFRVKDGPLVIDDFAPQFTSRADAALMHKKAHYVVRSVGNRSARGRSRADLTQQITRIPRGLVLMTAENPLIGQSIVGRMIYVGVQPGDILPAPGTTSDNPRLNALQEKAQRGLLAEAMSLYLGYLAANWERIAESFPQMVDAAGERARQAGGLQNRLPDAYGVLSAAQEVALRAFQDLGLVSAAEAGQLAEENNAALLEVIRSQAEQVAAESPVRKFFIGLSALLEQGKVFLAPRTKGVEFDSPIGADLVGYYEPGDDRVVYLRTESSLMSAKGFWRGLDENLDIMPDALRRQLSQLPGLLSQIGERQVEVTKFCQGNNQRVLVVDTAVVENLYGVSLRNQE
jgi:DNA primase